MIKLFRKAKLVAKLEKCQFGRTSVPFLGHIITPQGIMVDDKKIDAMINMKAPKNVHEIKVVMGMFNYYRQFIPNFSDIGRPITLLLRNNTIFKWGEEQQKAFDKFKYLLSHAPILHRPNFDKTFYVVTDASDVGIGAVLEQEGSDPEVHTRYPIAFWSRTLLPREQRYTVSERECLAIVEAIKSFRHYVHGLKFVVVTDHSALRWLHNAKDLNSRLTRWSLKLLEFDFTIEYRKGQDNANADALSRMTQNIEHSVAAITIDSVMSNN